MEYNSETDPCSVSYRRTSAFRVPSVTSNKAASCKSFAVTLRKARMGFFRSFRKILKFKKTPSFVMPVEFNNRNPTPESPRCSINQSRASVMIMPASSVCVTRPSLRRRTASYRVHSYCGNGSPVTAHRESVRFSHPVVRHEFVIETARLSTTSSIENGGENQRGRNNSAVTDISARSVEDLTLLENANGGNLLRPEEIWKWTSQSVTIDGVRETYDEFKDRLDGHTPRADSNKISKHAPSLNCIARLPTMKLTDAVFQSPENETVEINQAAIEKNRGDALKSLEGSLLPQNNDRYVLAIIPKEDLPITAVKVSPDQYPTCLMPEGQLAMLPREHMPDTAMLISTEQHPTCLLPGNQATSQRPHTYAGPNPSKGKHKAYNGVSQQTVIAQPSQDLELPPTPKMSKEEFHKRHSEHYKRVESGVFEEVKPQRIHRPTMSQGEFKKRHSDHCKRVESGIFDEDVLNETTFASPIPFALQPSNSATFLLPPTPPPTFPHPQPIRLYSVENAARIQRKLISTPASVPILSKPLPLAPALKTKKAVNAPLQTNVDRYPFVFKDTGKHFSAEPKYQPRTINYVEAKYRETEKAKKIRRASRLTDAREKQLATLQQLDTQLRRLLII